MKRVYTILLLFPLFLLISCGDDTPDFAKGDDILPLEHWFPMKLGSKQLEIQIPLSRNDQSKGLMFRESLGEDSGMLFPYKQPQQMSFWMKNTKIPLDIGFFDSDGILWEIHRMYPNDLTKTKSISDEIQFALEVNSGWFRKNSHGYPFS